MIIRDRQPLSNNHFTWGNAGCGVTAVIVASPTERARADKATIPLFEFGIVNPDGTFARLGVALTLNETHTQASKRLHRE